MNAGARDPARIARPVLFVALALPAVALVVAGFTDGLGANPVEKITHETGEWALRILVATLAITPLRRVTGWNWLARLRRMLGLYSFFYVALHLTTWAWLDQFFNLDDILADIIDRPYITVGFAAFCLLVPLAATSTNAMVRRLGGQRWRRLHQLAYVATLLACLHFLWLAKADLTEPLVYTTVTMALLAARLRPRQRAAA